MEMSKKNGPTDTNIYFKIIHRSKSGNSVMLWRFLWNEVLPDLVFAKCAVLSCGCVLA